ncbi:sensor histidine kinase [Clostridium thermarum]|uniref:sensor histidine kinase n=1 Tax=Clostridium thermarum TaxID=1716543 RepID=UPI0013D8B741|nr:sensor histidine kinase [Clostridium thermarum]
MKFLLKAINRFNDMKIRKKLMLIYIIVVLIPILVVGFYLTEGMRSMVIEKSIDEACTNNDRIQYRLNEIIKIANDVSDRMYFDEKLNKIVTTQYTSAADVVKVYNEYPIFDEFLRYYKEIASIRFYVENHTMLDNSQFTKVTEDTRKSYWYTRALANDGRIEWMYKTDEITGTDYLSLIRLVKDINRNRIGVLVININEDRLRALIKDEPFESIIAINEGKVVMSQNNKLRGTSIDFLSLEELKSRKEHYIVEKNYNGEESSIIMNSFSPEKASANCFQIVMIMPIANVTSKTTQISIRGISIMLVNLVLSIILITIFSKWFSERIILLRKEMHKVVTGEFNIEESIEGKDEIGELYEDLNKMMQSIKQLIHEVYEEKIQKEQLKNRQREAQFKMLASQINPHFLYNTLETIRMKAFVKGDHETAKIVKMLGKIMRRNLEVGDKPISLDSEVELVKNYLEIQRMRFGEKINYTINVDCDISNYFILPLLLQPIVENAFVHGLENKQGSGNIDLNIRAEKDNFIITVKDDGLGISPEKLEYLNKCLEDFTIGGKKSIGISNVNQRIKLYYGEEYGIKIRSRINEGTEVILILPKSKEVQGYAQSIDS